MNAENIEEHQMHAEYYTLTEEAANQLNAAKEQGNRIIGVGTTSIRTLESVIDPITKRFSAKEGWTDIFIYPGYEFKAIDGMITNFHLPKSSLIMLVSAFATREHTMNAYHEAIQHQYRFFSFGDAMFVY